MRIINITQNFLVLIVVPVVALVALTMLSLSFRARAESPILDASDEFFLALPIDGSSVSGPVEIVWKMKDDDTAATNYEVNLLDKNCNAKIGSISSLAESQNNFYIYEWDTTANLSDAAEIADGDYCIEVKSTFLNGTVPYPLSAKSRVSIKNSGNSSPRIVSAPADLSLAIGESFSYEVSVTDEDSETLSYAFIASPDWMSINKDSGLINGTPTISQANTVIIGVTDGKGGSDAQVFAVSTSSNALATLAFKNPVENSIFSGEVNEISWEASDSDGIERQTLEYSNNGVSWVLIGQFDESRKTANWDVSTIQNGKYYLRLTLTDGSPDRLVSQLISSQVVVANKTSNAQSTSIIYDISPLPDSNVEDQTPVLSGKFLSGSLSANIDISSVQVFLDGIETTKDCIVSESSFSCEAIRELEGGLHKVRVVFAGGDGADEKSWTFSVIGVSEADTIDTDTSDNSGELFGGLSVQGIVLIAGAICGILLILIVPWLLYSIWRKKNDDEFDDEVVTTSGTEYTPPQVSVVEPSGDAYTIGSQTIVGDSTGNTVAAKDFEITEIETTEEPTWGTDEQSVDVTKASKPVTVEGKMASSEDLSDDSQITQPHGYTPPTDDNGA